MIKFRGFGMVEILPTQSSVALAERPVATATEPRRICRDCSHRKTEHVFDVGTRPLMAKYGKCTVVGCGCEEYV